MKQAQTRITVHTQGQGLTDVTPQVSEWVGRQGIAAGLLTVFLKHTSASLVIQENADPDVLRDLTDVLRRLVPEDAGYRHSMEGPDDMPAHVKAALTATSLAVPVVDGRPDLGTWQGLFLFEHRHAPHSRTLTLHLLGE